MLSDDIADGTGKGISVAGKVVSDTLRGALLFGLIALAVGTAVGFPAALAFLGAHHLALGAWGIMAAVVHSGVTTGLGWGIFGAMAGAVVMGVTSIIPGRAEGFSYFKKKPQEKTPDQCTPEPQMQPSLTPPQPDNPYYQPGLGAKLAQKETAQTQAPGR